MAATLAALLSALDLCEVGTDRFVGRSPDVGWTRVYGGLIFAQALVAAARTVLDRPAHALHGSFLAPGDPAEPLHFAVERMRDGRSFANRRCTATQHGRPVFAMTASFHALEVGGFAHQGPMPDVPPPEALAPMAALPGAPAAMRGFLRRHASIDLRPVDQARFARDRAGPASASQSVWMRVAGPMPDDPALHAAVLAFMSDATLLDTALLPAGRSVFDDGVQAASLDHALWLHRPARADAWTLYVQDGIGAAGGRAFARGTLFSRDGRLVGSAAQEGLARERRA